MNTWVLDHSTMQSLLALVRKELVKLETERENLKDTIQIHYELSEPTTRIGQINFELYKAYLNRRRELTIKIAKLAKLSKTLKSEMAEVVAVDRIINKINNSKPLPHGTPLYQNQNSED